MDITHFYVEQGQGEPLILLHGNGENCGYFKGRMDAFSRRYHVYALDTRGRGSYQADRKKHTRRGAGLPAGGSFRRRQNPEAFNQKVLEFLGKD